MDYNSQMLKFSEFGMTSISKLFDDNAEMFLSVDPADAASKIVSITRLRATSLKTPASEDEMYQLLAAILGELLREKKIAIKTYGLSPIGIEEFNRLIASPPPPAWEPEPSGPAVDYKDVIAVCSGPVEVFNTKMRDAVFAQRYHEACAAGALGGL
jgi:hypothetical protein